MKFTIRIHDAVIIDKVTRKYLGKKGLTSVREEALTVTLKAQQHVPAGIVKQAIFELCEVKGLDEKDFAIWGYINERQGMRFQYV